MKILFEIKESLADIENQLLHSDFWITEVEEHPEEGKKIVTIRDFAYPQEATAEITDKGILIKTAWSKYTYRLFQKDNSYWCEYTGAYRGLLEQKLLPMITPKEKLKHFRQQTFGDIGFSTSDHPKRVYDAFIKEDYIPD